MFDKHFSTSDVAAEIDIEIQHILWKMIEQWKSEGVRLDYLQVFNLKIFRINNRLMQKIIHSQESPPLVSMMMFEVSKPINETIWVVDNDDSAVMMYPEEY